MAPSKIKLNGIAEALLLLFFSILVFTHIFRVSEGLMNISIAFTGIICFVYYVFFSDSELKLFGGIFCCAMTILMLVSTLYNWNSLVEHILWIWAYFGVALLLYEYGLSRISATLLVYIGCLFFVYYAVSGRAAVDEIFHGGSENNISTYCILLMIVYYLTELRAGNSRYISIIPILLILFISMWTATRSALLTLGLFLVFALIFNFTHNKITFRFVFAYLVIAGLVTYFVIHYIDQYTVALADKIEKYGNESARTDIWAEYINGLFDNAGNFMLGLSGSSVLYPNLCAYHGNAHNAFLMLHSRYGIVGFIIIIGFLLKAVIKLVKNKQIILISLLSVAVLRSMFDWTAFPGPLDIIFYFFILYASDDSEKQTTIICNQ